MQLIRKNYLLFSPAASTEIWTSKLRLIRFEQDFQNPDTESIVVRHCAHRAYERFLLKLHDKAKLDAENFYFDDRFPNLP